MNDNVLKLNSKTINDSEQEHNLCVYNLFSLFYEYLYFAGKCEIRCTHGLVDTVKCKCKCSEFWDGPYCGMPCLIIVDLEHRYRYV